MSRALSDVSAVKGKCHLPVYLGSGVTTANRGSLPRGGRLHHRQPFQDGGTGQVAVEAKRVERSWRRIASLEGNQGVVRNVFLMVKNTFWNGIRSRALA